MKPFTAYLSVAALLSSALGAPSSADLNKWESFKALHGKQHAPHEEAARMAKFLERSAAIEVHNARYAAGLESFSLKLNQFSDLSDEEFGRVALGFTPSNESLPEPHSLEAVPSIPSSLDYRQHNIMTPVKSQGACGSCYAFASAAVLESYLLRKAGQTYDLSEQDVVDCSFKKFMSNSVNGGCQGGHPTAVFEHFKQKDIVHEQDYPYVSGKTGTHYACRIPTAVNNIVRNRIKARHVSIDRESDLKQYLLQYGPGVIGMAADGEYKNYFRDLGNGIFDADYTINLRPNHVVVLAGYGTEGGKDYWLIKNSWGTSWGVGGYGKIIAGKNMANIMPSGFWFLE